MTDEPLYTLRDIATKLQLPASTVRYYRDAFAHHLPTIGHGRRRRYPTEAVETLRAIAQWYREGRTREQIEHDLAAPDGSADRLGPRQPVAHHAVPARLTESPAPDPTALLAELMEGERERRQAMWQIAREIVRLGEAVERQQATLLYVSERLDALTDHALPAASSTSAAVPESDTAPEPVSATASEDLLQELDALREELASEKNLVERLRASKLEIERRAAEAEERAGLRDEPDQRRSIFSRLLSRNE